jgi:hypothetical protein
MLTMPSSTSNFSVDEKQATVTAKRKEDDTAAVAQTSAATAQ